MCEGKIEIVKGLSYNEPSSLLPGPIFNLGEENEMQPLNGT